MFSMPTVSVIIPNYNHARFLEQRIESVLNQTFQDFELILLDDCSTDHSCQVLEKYRNHPQVSQILYNEQNSGNPFKQWNKGVRESKGELIWIAESDDYAEEGLLARLVAELERRPVVQVAYCQSWLVDAEDRILTSWTDHVGPLADFFRRDFVRPGTEIINEYMIYTCVIPNASAVVFRKQAFLEVGGAAESYRLTGDWALWISLLQKGDVAHAAAPLNYFRTHSQNVRTAAEKNGTYLEETSRVLVHIKERVNPPPEVTTRMLWHFFGFWTDYLLRNDIPFARTLAVYRHLKQIDPKVGRRIFKKLLREKRNTAGLLGKLLLDGLRYRSGQVNHK
jgi:glycosyltransferase involved in cell wall biosynthesis